MKTSPRITRPCPAFDGATLTLLLLLCAASLAQANPPITWHGWRPEEGIWTLAPGDPAATNWTHYGMNTALGSGGVLTRPKDYYTSVDLTAKIRATSVTTIMSAGMLVSAEDPLLSGPWGRGLRIDLQGYDMNQPFTQLIIYDTRNVDAAVVSLAGTPVQSITPAQGMTMRAQANAQGLTIWLNGWQAYPQTGVTQLQPPTPGYIGVDNYGCIINFTGLQATGTTTPPPPPDPPIPAHPLTPPVIPPVIPLPRIAAQKGLSPTLVPDAETSSPAHSGWKLATGSIRYEPQYDPRGDDMHLVCFAGSFFNARLPLNSDDPIGERPTFCCWFKAEPGTAPRLTLDSPANSYDVMSTSEAQKLSDGYWHYIERPLPQLAQDWDALTTLTASNQSGTMWLDTIRLRGDGRFIVKATGERFYPLGATFRNLVFDAESYSTMTAETVLTELSHSGCNCVRFWVGNMGNGGLAGDYNSTSSLNPAYMNNLIDFLRRATVHRIYALPVLEPLPYNNRFLRGVKSVAGSSDPDYVITGSNRVIMASEWMLIGQLVTHDMASYIARTGNAALLPTIFTWELANELFLEWSEGPFINPTVNTSPPTPRTGMQVTLANGRTYDMADNAQRQNALSDSIALWMRAMGNAVRQIDPEALISASWSWAYPTDPTVTYPPWVSAGNADPRTGILFSQMGGAAFGQECISDHTYGANPGELIPQANQLVELATTVYQNTGIPSFVGENGSARWTVGAENYVSVGGAVESGAPPTWSPVAGSPPGSITTTQDLERSGTVLQFQGSGTGSTWSAPGVTGVGASLRSHVRRMDSYEMWKATEPAPQTRVDSTTARETGRTHARAMMLRNQAHGGQPGWVASHVPQVPPTEHEQPRMLLRAADAPTYPIVSFWIRPMANAKFSLGLIGTSDTVLATYDLPALGLHADGRWHCLRIDTRDLPQGQRGAVQALQVSVAGTVFGDEFRINSAGNAPVVLAERGAVPADDGWFTDQYDVNNPGASAGARYVDNDRRSSRKHYVQLRSDSQMGAWHNVSGMTNQSVLGMWMRVHAGSSVQAGVESPLGAFTNVLAPGDATPNGRWRYVSAQLVGLVFDMRYPADDPHNTVQLSAVRWRIQGTVDIDDVRLDPYVASALKGRDNTLNVIPYMRVYGQQGHFVYPWDKNDGVFDWKEFFPNQNPDGGRMLRDFGME